MIFDEVDGLVCDLDGVVYRGDQAIEGSAEALDALAATGVRLLYCTNNSRLTVSEYVAKLDKVGVVARPDQVLTSGVVTAETLRDRKWVPARVLVVGGRGIDEELVGIGCELVQGTDADMVIVGWDPDFDYAAMRQASSTVRNGARLIATNADATFPAAGGELWPGAGSILASIETATGVRAEVMGKPNAPMMEAVDKRMTGCRRIAVVGDRPDTDLAGARSKGWMTALVLSGVTQSGDVDRVEERPDVVAKDLAALVRGDVQ
jgi:phosphoglycolate/pyridoxal phosphate phosphatase family enzyme